jgi:hypothetical protein
MPTVPEDKVMWILLWVITSMTYGPTKSSGSQVFHSLSSCQAAADFLKSIKSGYVEVKCVEDKK